MCLAPRLCLQLIVTKLRPGPVSLQDIPDNIAFSSVSESAKQSLYHALKNIYAYTLGTEDGADHSEADTRLHALVMQLEAGLGSALRQQQQASLFKTMLICLKTVVCSLYCTSSILPSCSSIAAKLHAGQVMYDA